MPEREKTMKITQNDKLQPHESHGKSLSAKAEEYAFAECEMYAREGKFGRYSVSFLEELKWRDPDRLSRKGYCIYKGVLEEILGDFFETP